MVVAAVGKNSFVGKRVPRVDAREKVTGKSIFAPDIEVPGMLYAKIVRSTKAHAKIRAINTQAALKIPGVVKIIVAKDVPGENVVPVVNDDQPLLADKITRFHGEAIAIILAETERAAERAEKQVSIDYKEFTPLLSIEEARFGKRKVHKDKPDNIAAECRVVKGNVKTGFKKAYKIFEAKYRVGYQEHAYIETQGAVAIPGPEKASITVYSSTQCPFYVQGAVSRALGYPFDRVRVVQATTGGAFGGKEDVPSIVGCLAAVAAHVAGRPVRLIYSRREDILSTSKRHPAIMHYKMGVSKDGRLVAAKITYETDAGAYTTLSPVVLFRGTVHALGPYKCPNVAIQGTSYFTNKVPCGAFRGFGSPQVIFAHESHMDFIAKEMGMSPVEIRRKNLLNVGDETATGHKLTSSVGIREAFEAAVNVSGWKKKYNPKGKRKKGHIRSGLGIATVYYGVGLGAAGAALDKSAAVIKVHKDGMATVMLGTTEMGQGALTVFAQMSAESLGFDIQSIKVVDPDTNIVPDSGPTVASRATLVGGRAIMDACRQIRKTMIRRAAKMLKVSQDKIFFKEGEVFVGGKRSKKTTADVANECHINSEKLSAVGWYKAPKLVWDARTGRGAAYLTYSFGTQVAEVEVDTRTGKTDIKNFYAAHDVGRAINPIGVEGQIEGGVVQGMGYAFMEEIIHDKDGRMLNPEFTDYLIPTAKDAPKIVPIIIEAPFPGGPFGAKGIGEPSLMPAPAAVANAISNATGKTIRELPVTMEKLFWKIHNGKE